MDRSSQHARQHTLTPATRPALAPESLRVSKSLINPLFDIDSCGVGFVATVIGGPTHRILELALIALSRLAHRGATAADGKSSDGVGLMTAIPRDLLLRATGISLAPQRDLAVGMLFLPQNPTTLDFTPEAALARCLASHDLEILCWRDVPTAPQALGEIALSAMPRIRQALIVDKLELTPEAPDAGPDTLERRLYLARKQFERMQDQGKVEGYICSLSSQTLVYKAMCSGALLPSFYPDLTDPSYITSFTVFHQRYATNTAPSWNRAQPARSLAHNGEINTVWGNRARMAARDSTLPIECKPVLTAGGTDSTSLDEAVELISKNGRSLAEAVRMLLPPAVTTQRKSTFLSYHADCVEPWDGPAAIAFSDGRIVGAALDRNGLRPSRFAITEGGLVIAGSEAGLIDLDPEFVIQSGRLGPGQMLVVDLIDQRVFQDDELLTIFDTGATYARLLDPQPFEPAVSNDVLPAAELIALQRGFGYTREDVNMILKPMAAEGKDGVWSMGDDTPLAFLARAPRPLYAFFRQRFAQVTNPAIDPLREACVVSLHTRLGPWSHMLDKNAPLAGVSLASPFLSLDQIAALRRGEHPHAAELTVAELPCVFTPAKTLREGLDAVCQQAIELVRDGARILILSDRSATLKTGTSEARIAIPMAMATGAVHEALVAAGLRTLVGLAVDAGDCRDIHHAAILIGYGAGAVCPWLALETARSLGGLEPALAEKKMLKSFDAGLAKVMSKMGISVVDSYRGAHLFDILGLHKSVVDHCFPGTPAPLSGIGFSELDRQLRLNWTPDDVPAAAELPDYGWVRFRKADLAEPHAWQPANVKALQTTVGSTRAGVTSPDPAAAFAIFTQELTSREPAVLRDLLAIRPNGPQLDLSEIEPAKSLYKRFVASAMSLGSLSPEAHTCITIAMNTLGGRSNTGEGGEDPEVYKTSPNHEVIPSNARNLRISPEAPQLHLQGSLTTAELQHSATQATQPGAPFIAPLSHAMSGKVQSSGPSSAVAELDPPEPPLLRNNRIKQVASGRFGVTNEYLAHADEIEIKVAQGAKPGEGGQLPGHKVSGLIARLRHAQPGVSLISPPPHHDIYSIEDLAQLIYDLKRINPRAAVGVKLVSSCGVGTVAAGVAKAYADFIVIAGNTGGTGAAALSSIKYAGNPWELGLAEAQQVLMHNGMRGRVRLRTDGGLATAQDVLIAALLGADEFAFGTSVLVAIGCDMARQCHLNTCPTGIATQKPELRAKFRGKPEHIIHFFEELAADLRRLLARYGLPSIEAAIGRTDLLEQVRFDGNLDLEPMLASSSTAEVIPSNARNLRISLGAPPPHPQQTIARSWQGIRNTQPQDRPPLDESWTAPALEAIHAGQPFTLETTITNADRAVGARLSGELGLLRAQQPTPADVTITLNGTAGQSFGAFAAQGITLILNGQANDFVGKGLSGANLIIRAQGRAAHDSGHHVLLGNVALYGATSGTLFAAGCAGERFAVRNSGVTAVVEGVGDHGCEYMTGGTVVILGKTGINFAAGMTGGLAWVFDRDGSFVSQQRFHPDFVEVEPFSTLDPEAQESLHTLLLRHAADAHSNLAQTMLTNWEQFAPNFVRLSPKPQS